MSENSRIAPLVASILLSFDKLIANLNASDGPHASAASSSLGRFKLWSASLGAHRPRGTRSLEFKLRDASTLQRHVISLLKELRDVVIKITEALDSPTDRSTAEALRTHKCNETFDDELAEYFSRNDSQDGSVVDELLDDIRHIIDRLLRLSFIIRNPTPHDHFLSRQAAEFIEGSEPFDIHHVHEKFPELAQEVAERLGKSLSVRRQYFRYRDEHFHRLAEGLSGSEAELLDSHEQATTITSPISDHLKSEDDSTATVVQTCDISFDDIDDRSELSATSYAASEANSDQPRVPPMPSGYANGPIKCPFCHSIVLIGSRRAWKKHVFRDLQPYVCLAHTCSAASRLYERRKDWSQHMYLEHWRLWKCPFGCHKYMRSAERFQQHISSVHKDELSEHHTSSLARLCSVSDHAQARGPCIFCDHHLTSDKLYISHVALHLEQLALFALPSVDYEQDEDHDGSEEGGKQIDDGKTNNTNGEPEQEQSDQDQDDNNDYGEHAVREESAGQIEDPKSLPSQAGPSVKAVSIKDEKAKQSRERRKVPNTSNKGTRTQKTRTVWHCCHCNCGFLNYVIDDFCPDCQHRRCSRCIVTTETS